MKSNEKTKAKRNEIVLCRRCNRPLLDVVSRALGMGKVCRSKFGFSGKKPSKKLQKFLEFTFLGM